MNSKGTKKDFTCQLAWKLTLCVEHHKTSQAFRSATQISSSPWIITKAGRMEHLIHHVACEQLKSNAVWGGWVCSLGKTEAISGCDSVLPPLA